MVTFAKRYTGELMLIAGGWLLFSAACWAVLLDSSISDWNLDRTTGFGLWFARNGIGVMGVLFALSTIGGVVLMICGIWWVTRRRKYHRLPPD